MFGIWVLVKCWWTEVKIVPILRSSRKWRSVDTSQNNRQWVEFESLNRPRHLDRGIGHANTWMLHHDYVPCHTAICVNDVLTKKCIPFVPQPHVRLIWVRVTSSFSQNWNSTSKVVILELWTTYKGRDRPFEGTSSTATGSDVSGGVWLPKGTTLKGMMLTFSSVVNKKNYITSRITFYTHFVCSQEYYCNTLCARNL
jgi:hypothetical protein